MIDLRRSSCSIDIDATSLVWFFKPQSAYEFHSQSYSECSDGLFTI